MEVRDKVVVVTGGARGIGAAVCRRFVLEEARGIVVADRDGDVAGELASELGGLAVACDVSDEEQVRELVERTVERFGGLDVFCANAGVTTKGGVETANDDWQRLWDVNVMSLVYSARHAVPWLLEADGGAFVVTASAAGLLTEIGSASYSVTKHAAVAFAEWLAVQHRGGLHVSCLCPMGVATDMLEDDDPVHRFLSLNSVTADDVAGHLVQAIRDETFLVLPQDEVAELLKFKVRDFDHWLRNLRRLKEKTQRQKVA